MCIFVQKCAKLCIADDFFMSDKECSWEYKRLEASLLEAERARPNALAFAYCALNLALFPAERARPNALAFAYCALNLALFPSERARFELANRF